MKQSRFTSFIIIIRSFFSFAATTFYSLLLNYTGRMTREKANQIIQHWSKSQLNIAKILRTHIQHGPPIEFKSGRAYIIICNHTSLYDIPLSLEALPRNVRMLTKKELFKIPLMGQLMKHNEFISIDRKNKTQALADLNYAKKKMQDGIALWSAPEGTRSTTGKLLPFKKGVFHLALRTQAIIIPIGIKGANLVLPAHTFRFQTNQPVEVHLGEPIDTRQLKNQTLTTLMNLVRKKLSNLIQDSAVAKRDKK